MNKLKMRHKSCVKQDNCFVKFKSHSLQHPRKITRDEGAEQTEVEGDANDY